MIRALACVFALLAAALAASPAAAQTLASLSPAPQAARPMLRAAVTVTDDVVRIGDLVDNAGIVANIAVFRAPDPGTTGRVPASQVIEAVAAHQLIGLSANGIREIRVTRPGRRIATSDFETQIAAALASRYGLGNEHDIELRFDNPPEAIAVDAHSNAEINVEQLNYLARSGRFDAVVEVVGIETRRLRLSGTAQATAEVVTLNRSLNRGEIVRATDVVVERRPRAQLPSDILGDTRNVVGHAARNAISSGKPLRANDLTKPHLVQRNEFVTLIFEVPGITLTMRGKANESGSEGDLVEVLNVQSKRTVHGIVTGQGRVVVSSLDANAKVSRNSAVSSNSSFKSTSAAVRAQ